MQPSVQINQTQIELVQGDITTQETDAIVNAANAWLAGGGGVDGAIHRAAGADDLQTACRALGGCDTGDAKITPGFRLKAKHIIHAVGPVYVPMSEDPPRLLASAYRRSLEVAAENGLTSIAFPAISTGVYGYPMAEAAEVAVQTCIIFAKEDTRISLIRFVLYDSRAFMIFKSVLERLTG